MKGSDIVEAFTYIQEAKSIIESSPMRNENNWRLIFGTPLSELKTITADLELLAAKCAQPLKIVILGEVKSGKSTLLNALAGGKVSPTDVTEATASIFEISYGTREYAAINFVDGSIDEGTPTQIFSILSQNQNDQAFFERCKVVEIKLPLTQLTKLTIVDTPGLATITGQNASRSQAYFQQADVVLWVFNGHYLGQNDVSAELEAVAELGKPIIGVINRIDELEGERDKYVRYVKRELGIYLREVFPLSAFQAFEGVINDDDKKLGQSGYNDLLYYLENKIERQAYTVQNDSLTASAKSLMGRELLAHQAQLTELAGKTMLIEQSKEKVKQQSEYIKQQHQSTVQAWFGQEFLADKERALNEKIQALSVMSMNAGENDIKAAIEEFFSEQAIRAEIDQFMFRLDSEVKAEWQTGLKAIQTEVTEDYNKLINQYHTQAQIILDQLPMPGKSALTGAGEGALTAGVFGGAIATYSAVLGPAAAKVSLASAFGAIVPPLLFAGAATGAVAALMKFRNVKSEYGRTVSQSVDNIRADMRAKLMPDILKVIDTVGKSVVERVQTQLLAESFNGADEEEVLRYRMAMEQYCRKVESKLY